VEVVRAIRAAARPRAAELEDIGGKVLRVAILIAFGSRASVVYLLLTMETGGRSAATAVGLVIVLKPR